MTPDLAGIQGSRTPGRAFLVFPGITSSPRIERRLRAAGFEEPKHHAKGGPCSHPSTRPSPTISGVQRVGPA